jgi:flavin reductase
MNTLASLTQPIEPVVDVPPQIFRDAMSRLGAAVNIITTDGPAGKAGFAATAVCSVTDTPPTLLVCLNRSASVFDAVTGNGRLCVNVLNGDQDRLSTLFGGKTPVEERFAAADWSQGITGAPMLDGAMASFDCEITEMKDIGTHRVLFCTVKAIRLGEAENVLVYFQRGYHRLSSATAA